MGIKWLGYLDSFGYFKQSDLTVLKNASIFNANWKLYSMQLLNLTITNTPGISFKICEGIHSFRKSLCQHIKFLGCGAKCSLKTTVIQESWSLRQTLQGSRPHMGGLHTRHSWFLCLHLSQSWVNPQAQHFF